MPRLLRSAGPPTRSLRLELLEDRCVLAATLEMLTEASGADSLSSNPHSFTIVGDLTYFVATTPDAGEELWVTDGSTSGTHLIKDLRPGNVGSIPRDLTNINGSLYFMASGTPGLHANLWRIGEVGEEPAAVLNANGDRMVFAGAPVNVNGYFYFAGGKGDNDVWLWRTDGTPSGTVKIKDVRPGKGMANVSGTLFFSTGTGGLGNELWRSDGTEAGTFRVKDINPGDASSIWTLEPTAAVYGVIFFSARDAGENFELWRSDGTAPGTYRVKEVQAGAAGSSPMNFISVGGKLFFTADDGTNGRELWTSDGTDGGTVLLTTASDAAGPSDLTEMNGVLYFASSGVLWRSDGTAAGTYSVLGNTSNASTGALPSIAGGQSYGGYDNIVNVNGTLYFPGRFSSGFYRLWRSDGTAAGSSFVDPKPAGNYVFQTLYRLTNINGTLYFVGESAFGGNAEPWIGGENGVYPVTLKDLTAYSAGLNGASLAKAGGKLLFMGNDSPQLGGNRLWTSDGTHGGTKSFISLPRPIDSNWPIISVGEITFFTISNQLWRTDGTASGTFVLTNTPISNGASATVKDGLLYFFSAGSLWRSNRTAAGTFDLGNLAPSGGSVSPSSKIIEFNGQLFLTLGTSNGMGLFKSDGTAAGTTLLRGGFTGTPLDDFTNVAGTLYFSASSGPSPPSQVWRTDGTEAGTLLLRDLNLSANGLGSVRQFSNVGGKLMFIGRDGVTGHELWTSDGTVVGTLMVKDIQSNSTFDDPYARVLAVVGKDLFFTASSGRTLHLWKSNGTEAGTIPVRELVSLPSAGALDAVNVNGVLYFTAAGTGFDGRYTGFELWRSDGTTAGTHVAFDLNSLLPGSSPRALTNVNGSLYFLANDGAHGEELWVARHEAAIDRGDYNANGVVDGADFLSWQRAFGTANPSNDGDGDGTVGGGDLNVWRENFGTSGGAAASGVAVSVAALVADEDESAGAKLAAAIVGDFEDKYAGLGDRAREALFAAGDFSRLFLAGGDEAENRWALRGRGRASLARRG